MKRERELVRAALEGMNDLVVICDVRGRVVVLNRAMERFVSRAPWLARSDIAFPLDQYDLDGAAIAPADAPLARALRGETLTDVRVQVKTELGERRSMLASGQQLLAADGVILGAMVTWRDVTESPEAGRFRVAQDEVTGLPNRALFIDRLKNALARGDRHAWTTAVLAVNLDRFADLAARLGGDSGDRVLAAVALRLEACLRPYDTVLRPPGTVARLGGDQFLVMCEHITDERSAELMAVRIDGALREPMELGGRTISLTAGVGITLTNDSAAEPETLILEAETALHRAKHRGIGRHELFAREMQSELHARIESEDELRDALAREEFRLVYQPKVSLVTQRTTGVEALLRWHHPTAGLIPPLDFIPLAEESGLIVPIGSWVFEQVCRDIKRWSTSLPGGMPLMVSVNVSPRQFQSGLAETFGSIMETAGVDPATLCLEVTESMMMRDPEFAVTTLSKLKSLGLRISIDDFGTGFSSLAYLKRFPLDELKIDKSFIDGLQHNREDIAIVAAVMGMAHALDLRVVAEGVETVEQATKLRVLGCDEAQGYYYARPCPPAAVDDLLAAEAKQGDGGDRQAALSDGGRRVLVVDDTADVRQLARVSLVAAGFEVCEVASGEEALSAMPGFRPDCVVLDVNLPGISGMDVGRLLREDPAAHGTTIVMLTADIDPAEKVEAFSFRADDYIEKPFSPRDLVSRVSAAMRRHNANPVPAAP